MDINALSPYIRVAMHSTLVSPFSINERVIYDYELIFVQNGKCRIRIDGTDYLCKKNHVVLLPPGVPHSFHSAIDNTNFVQPHFHFDAVYNEKSAETPVSFKNLNEMNNYEKSLIQEHIFSELKIPYVFTPDNLSEFQNTFFRIIDIFTANPPDYQLLYKAEILKLLHLIFAQFATHSSEFKGNNVQLIKDYIDSNFYQNISLDFLANQFYINKYTMLRRFKQEYGKNIIKYCNEKRLNESKRLLKVTNLSIKDIGNRLNFSDAYSFSRFFKNETGISPNKYRNY